MSFLFGQHKLSQNELRDCFDWFRKQYKLITFQDHEAEVYNNSLLADGENIQKSVESAKKVANACNRLVQAAESLIDQHSKIKFVPRVATADHYAWGQVFLQWKAWAVASRSAIEAVTKGSSFDQSYVQGLLNDFENLRLNGKKEEEKLIKLMYRSGATLADFQKLWDEAIQNMPK